MANKIRGSPPRETGVRRLGTRRFPPQATAGSYALGPPGAGLMGVRSSHGPGPPRARALAAAFVLVLASGIIHRPLARESAHTATAQQTLRHKKEPYTSSKVCGSCHTAIYTKWQNSMHANAYKDPVFY